MFATLRDQVCILFDVGFAYLDDGGRLYRMPVERYAALLDACASSSAAAVVQRYPSLFELTASADSAAQGVEQAHGRWRLLQESGS